VEKGIKTLGPLSLVVNCAVKNDAVEIAEKVRRDRGDLAFQTTTGKAVTITGGMCKILQPEG
jgi:hypothetical protein